MHIWRRDENQGTDESLEEAGVGGTYATVRMKSEPGGGKAAKGAKANKGRPATAACGAYYYTL